MSDKPAVYILHGDDEFGITEFIHILEQKIGEPSTAEMNTTRLDGKSTSLNTLVTAAHAMPFLAERRLVILDDPLGNLKSAANRERFTTVLENSPITTALVVIIPRLLTDKSDRDDRPKHWLLKWVSTQGSRVYARSFKLPEGSQMARWIQTRAVEMGGNISFQAAGLLGSYVQDNPRLAAQEISKLLAYVNYRRTIDIDDVEQLTPDSAEGNVFHMVDAIGNRNGQLALRTLHRLLENNDPLSLFGMIIRQFRLLIQVKEMLDAGYREADIAKPLNTYPFVVRKLASQSRNFSLQNLESIYHKLLDIDEAIKTGRTDVEVALDTCIVALTA